MYQRLLFCLVLIAALTAHAQDINIRGKVTNRSGEAVAGAVVELVNEGIKDTSGADGSYLITNQTGTIVQSLLPHSEQIVLNKGVLKLSLKKSSPVKVTILDVKGNLLKKETFENLSAGFYRWDIAEHSRVSKLLVIHGSIGRRTTTFRYLPLQNGKYVLNSSAERSTMVGGTLAKMAAAINDTLKVTANGFAEKMVVVTSYDLEQNITLFGEDDVVVQLDATRQVIDGFGINNTWGGGWNDQVADELFDSVNGLGLTILRIGMGPDGNPYNGNSCWEDIRKVKARGAKYIIGTLWTPPANMKTNNDLNRGGHLKPEFYDEWATTVAEFPAKVKQGSGYDLYGMSPQNETDFASCGNQEPCNGDYNTCIYTGKEYADFLKVVGPKIKAAGCLVIAPEASEWLHVWSNVSGCCSEPSGRPSSDPLECGCFTGRDTPCSDHCASGEGGYEYGRWMYKDPESWAQIDILGTHQYDTQVAEPWPDDIPQGDIRVWQTEMSGVRYWPEQGPSDDIANGVAVAGWVHNALTVGEANAWCWWWYKALGGTNEGLRESDGSDTKRHYTFGNFTRYVRPGMIRVDVIGGDGENVLLTAYKNNAGKVVIVAINKGSSAASIPVYLDGDTAPSSFMPIVTNGNANWDERSPVSVSNGSFTAELERVSVTTFVSQ